MKKDIVIYVDLKYLNYLMARVLTNMIYVINVLNLLGQQFVRRVMEQERKEFAMMKQLLHKLRAEKIEPNIKLFHVINVKRNKI